jgi:hypothetical protein
LRKNLVFTLVLQLIQLIFSQLTNRKTLIKEREAIMKKRALNRSTIILFIGLLLVGLIFSGSLAGPAASTGERLGGGPSLEIMAGDGPARPSVQRFTESYLLTAPEMATITVVYSGTWTAPAMTAFQFAVDIWETQITSGVEIEVLAEWKPLVPAGVLGSARAYDYVRNFPGAPVADTWYPYPLVNKLAGSDQDPANPDIVASFNSSRSDWYFGTDASPPGNQFDLVSVVLHEIGHGLGFAGSMVVSGGMGSWGLGTPYPFIYDRFTENGSGQSLWQDFPNNSVALANQLTGGDIFFNGPNTNPANGGSPAELYAPGTWQQGSSYSHLDEVFNGTPNALMTFSLDGGEANHAPGPVMLGIFADLGWTIDNGGPTPTGTVPGPTPTVTPTPVKSYLPAVVRNFYASGPLPGFWEGAFDSLFVSPDQSMVLDYTTVFDFQNCGQLPITHPNDFPIVNDQFAQGGAFAVTGTFTSQTTVTGMVELVDYFVPACNASYTGGPFPWSAAWVDDSQPTLVVEGSPFEASPSGSGAPAVRQTQ